MEGWSGLLERIHWPLPLSENLIAYDPTAEPLMIKAEKSNLYTMRPGASARGLTSPPRGILKSQGRGNLGVGKVHFSVDKYG